MTLFSLYTLQYGAQYLRDCVREWRVPGDGWVGDC